MVRIILGLTLALTLFFPAVPAHADRRVALVIGNGDYARHGSLRNPVNDAADMAALLKALGYTLVKGMEHQNVRRQQFLDLIREFAAMIGPGDVALFYYAGHGMQVEGVNYLIPVDDGDIRFRDDVPDLAVSLETLRRQFAGRGAQPLIVILDACRDNPLPGRTRGSSRGLARLELGGGTFIAFATGPGAVADDGNRRNGRFTGALLSTLRANPARRIEDIFIEVTVKVERESDGAQTPWVSSNLRAPFHFTTTAPPALPPAAVAPRPPLPPTGDTVRQQPAPSIDGADLPAGQLRALLSALQAPVGTSVEWTGPESSESGAAATVREGYSTKGEYCREFMLTVRSTDESRVYGTVCGVPGGASWRLVQ